MNDKITSLGVLLLTVFLVGCGGYSSPGNDVAANPVASPPPVVQADDDGDGVLNASDACPTTPNGSSVNSDGCSAKLCQAAASSAVKMCFDTAVARASECYENDSSECAPDDVQLQQSLNLLESAFVAECGSDLTVQQAGYGVNISDDAVLAQLQNACIGEPATLVARTYGGPNATLLVGANPATQTCLTTAYDQAAAIISNDYADYATCIADNTCSAIADSSARDAQANATITAACAPSLSVVQGSDPALFVSRAKLQAQCLVAFAHGDTSNVALNCGPDSQLLQAINIRNIDFTDTNLTVDDISRGTPLQIVLDSDAWGTRCGDGSAYAFQLRLAPDGEPVDKLITHQEGGGVCLVGTGDCVTRPANLFNALDNGADDLDGYMSTRSDNPFRNWSVLHQPYCTQDLFIGGGNDEPGGPPSHNGFVYRYGSINLRASLQFFRDLLWRFRRDGRVEGSETGYLPSQPRLVFSGTSAGGYGVQYNLHYPLDELRWENTIGHPHAAFLMPGGTTDLRLLFSTVGNTWGTRPYQPPYCLDTGCGVSEVNFPAHAARLGKTPFQKLLNSSAQHDTVQEPTQGYPGPVDTGFDITGFTAVDWINRARQTYCDLKDTPNLFFHFGANTQGTHDFINTNAPFEPNQVCVPQLLVNGSGMVRWLHGIAENGVEAIDRVEEGPTLNGVDDFSCDLTSPDANGDFDLDMALNVNDICPGTATGSAVALNGCAIAAGDSDSDGIPDDRDFCAATAAADVADQYGCSQTQVDAGGHTSAQATADCLFAD